MAIKKFKESDTDPVIKKISIREVKALKYLTHPNVVQFKEAFKRDKKLHIVFEYVDQTVLEMLENSNDALGLDLEVIRKLIFQVLKALEYLHENKIIHRDVKPENLLVNKKGTLKLCDFGFARKISGLSGRGFCIWILRAGVTVEELTDYVATRWYRSPELVVTNRYSFPVDIWSVGCILGELIDGEPMFPGDDALDQLVKIYQNVGPMHRKLLKQMESMFGANAYKLMGSKHKNLEPLEICRRKMKARYKKKINATALDLLTRLLDNNPETRPTAKEALRHEWFSDLVMKDPQLRSKLKMDVKRSETINVEKILGELCSNNENRMVHNLPKESDKKEKIFRFSDIEKKKNLKESMREKLTGNSHLPKPKKSSFSLEKTGLKGYYGITKTKPAPSINKENLENKSRALIHEKIKQKNFSVTKKKPIKTKLGMNMGFSMIPKLSEHSNRSRDPKPGNIKSLINTAFQFDKRRIPGVSMGKTASKKPYLKKKSKTTQIKSKVYQNTFSCLGYKINHKLGNIQKHLKQKRLHVGEKIRPINDRNKRRVKESRRNKKLMEGTGCCP